MAVRKPRSQAAWPQVPAFDFERKAFYTPAEIANIVGISDQTVLQRIHEGKLYAVQLGTRTFRITLASLMQFLGAPPRVRRTYHPTAHVDMNKDFADDSAEHRHRGR